MRQAVALRAPGAYASCARRLRFVRQALELHALSVGWQLFVCVVHSPVASASGRKILST